MKRIIKFRCWDTESNIMLYEGDYAHFMGCDSIFVGASEKGAVFFERCGEVNDKLDYGDPEDYIVMQFTGELDDNEKEIYEDDIIKVNAEGSEWVQDVGMHDIAGFNYEGDTSIVVIGNVHQNPELLK